MSKRKIITMVYLLLIILPILTSCGRETKLSADNIKENTILIRQDGTLEQYITETFKEEYYKEKDLAAFAEEAMENYNNGKEKKQVSLVSVKVKDKTAHMMIEYETVEDFAAFNSLDASFLSVKEAKEQKILPEILYKSGKGTKVSLEKAKLEDSWHVFCMSGNTNITTAGEMKYYNNAILLNQTTVKANTEEMAFIIFK